MLSSKRAKCLELLLEGNLTDKEIADAINITPKTVCVWKKDEEFQSEYEKLLRNRLLYAAPKALRKEVRLLNSQSDMVAHLAAKDILDRAGFTPTENLNLVGNVVTIIDDIPDAPLETVK
ncbi:MAG: helix-turn-helix domain-containing protein [Clostridia bacterium]|nr:helix-turn-helix domain-containing protein [Clostridia bacterium]